VNEIVRDWCGSLHRDDLLGLDAAGIAELRRKRVI
jgi:hypothetical protein